MSDEKKTDTKASKAAPDVMVTMRHEGDTHDWTVTIGEESFAVVKGEAQIPLRLLEGAELAGFRRVT